MQDLPMLSLQYALKLQGYQVTYLGQIDAGKLQTICIQCKPDFVITHTTRKVNSTENINIVEQLVSLPSPLKFISIENDFVAGKQCKNYEVIQTIPGAVEKFMTPP